MTLPFGAIRLPMSVIAIATALLLPLRAWADVEANPTDDKAGLAVAKSLSGDPESSDAPSVEWPLKRLYCVEYARLRSGFAIFGDAKLWWSHARNLYSEFAKPVAQAVMVFSGSKRIVHGHVAVVTQILSAREIIVDHANWQNQGEIDRNMPVLDVSAANDWSKVRVWDVNSGAFGSHIYAIRGFIARSGPRLASAGL